MTMPTSVASSAVNPAAEAAAAEAIAMGGQQARRLTMLFALLLGIVAIVPVVLITSLAMHQLAVQPRLTPYAVVLAVLL